MKPWTKGYPKPFKNLYPKLEKTVNHINPIDTPPPPIALINTDILAFRGNRTALRNFFIIPWFLAIVVLSVIWSHEFIDGWKKTEASLSKTIQRQKKIYGKDIFEISEDPYLQHMLSRFDENMVMPLNKYLNYHYYETWKIGGRERLITDIFKLFLCGIGGLALFFWMLLFRRESLLYFDRERRIVYKWAYGKAHAQHYDQLEITESGIGMHILLCRENARSMKDWRGFVFQPTQNPFYSPPEYNKPALAYVMRFMDAGMSAIRNEPYDQSRKGWFLHEDKKPAGFEQRVDQILMNIERARTSFNLGYR